jgi:FlaG/FlaF family flagellin (archaellin)
MNLPVLDPEITDGKHSSRWMVTIFDNDVTPVDLVMLTIISATNCSVDEAEIEVWEAQAYGKASIHFDSQSICERIANTMLSIGVKATVDPEWTD